jgi:beta-N-acetylhexosaminidase
MADRDGADTAKQQGTDTGEALSKLGINVDLAPVLDVPQAASPESLSSRAFGTDPGEVSELGVAFAEGLSDGGVAATAKHFPGLGQSLANPDDEKSTVKASEEDLDADLEPFKSAIDAGVPLVMTSNAIYPALESTDPAAWSPSITKDLLRDELGFEGAIITDDLESAAVKAAAGSPDRAAVQVLRNGGDLVLFALSEGGSKKGFETIVKAVGNGRLERSALEDAYDHVIALKNSIARD